MPQHQFDPNFYQSKKAEREKHKNKPDFKAISSADKDYLLYLLAKQAGLIPPGMKYKV